MSHKCIKCEGRLHGFLCSDRNTEEMNGTTCRQCDADMVWVTETEEIGNKEGNEEWQICQNNKTKNRKKGTHKNKKTGIGPTSIM